MHIDIDSVQGDATLGFERFLVEKKGLDSVESLDQARALVQTLSRDGIVGVQCFLGATDDPRFRAQARELEKRIRQQARSTEERIRCIVEGSVHGERRERPAIPDVAAEVVGFASEQKKDFVRPSRQEAWKLVDTLKDAANLFADRQNAKASGSKVERLQALIADLVKRFEPDPEFQKIVHDLPKLDLKISIPEYQMHAVALMDYLKRISGKEITVQGVSVDEKTPPFSAKEVDKTSMAQELEAIDREWDAIHAAMPPALVPKDFQSVPNEAEPSTPLRQRLNEKADTALQSGDETLMKLAVDEIEKHLVGGISVREQELEGLYRLSGADRTEFVIARIEELEFANAIDRKTVHRRRLQLEIVSLQKGQKKADAEVLTAQDAIRAFDNQALPSDALAPKIPSLPMSGQLQRESLEAVLSRALMQQKEMMEQLARKNQEIHELDSTILQLSRLLLRAQESQQRLMDRQTASEGEGAQQDAEEDLDQSPADSWVHGEDREDDLQSPSSSSFGGAAFSGASDGGGSARSSRGGGGVEQLAQKVVQAARDPFGSIGDAVGDLFVPGSRKG